MAMCSALKVRFFIHSVKTIYTIDMYEVARAKMQCNPEFFLSYDTNDNNYCNIISRLYLQPRKSLRLF